MGDFAVSGALLIFALVILCVDYRDKLNEVGFAVWVAVAIAVLTKF